MHYAATTISELQDVAAQLVSLLRQAAVIELVGDVGAGKTTFVKGLAKGLGITEEISSPSYTINRQYEIPDGRMLSHYDFYRLVEPGIIKAEIAEDIADENTITVIEWVESVSDVLPEKRIIVVITSPSESTRDITIKGIEGLKS